MNPPRGSTRFIEHEAKGSPNGRMRDAGREARPLRGHDRRAACALLGLCRPQSLRHRLDLPVNRARISSRGMAGGAPDFGHIGDLGALELDWRFPLRSPWPAPDLAARRRLRRRDDGGHGRRLGLPLDVRRARSSRHRRRRRLGGRAGDDQRGIGAFPQEHQSRRLHRRLYADRGGCRQLHHHTAHRALGLAPGLPHHRRSDARHSRRSLRVHARAAKTRGAAGGLAARARPLPRSFHGRPHRRGMRRPHLAADLRWLQPALPHENPRLQLRGDGDHRGDLGLLRRRGPDPRSARVGIFRQAPGGIRERGL